MHCVGRRSCESFLAGASRNTTPRRLVMKANGRVDRSLLAGLVLCVSSGGAAIGQELLWSFETGG